MLGQNKLLLFPDAQRGYLITTIGGNTIFLCGVLVYFLTSKGDFVNVLTSGNYPSKILFNMTAASPLLIESFGLERVHPPAFFRSIGEINEYSGRMPYSHLMRRAWESMELSGIFCVNKKPTVYFKEVKRIDSWQIKKLHRQLWNQGLATLLVVASRAEVRIFSGLAYPAREDEDAADGDRLVEIIDRTSDVLELRRFIQKVETGQIYRDRAECFDSGKNVDQYLLDNLGKTRDMLVEVDSKIERKTIHALLGRVIFTSYLSDRKFINGRQFTDVGARGAGNLRELFNNYSALEARDILYNLFGQLQDYFNGSMFDEKISEERSVIKEGHIRLLKRFLNGEEVDSGQFSFGFWVYDFSVIPIETISAIYEDFIAAENPEGQRKRGAYYTPMHLAEMVVDAAVEGWEGSLLGKRFLDPSCGSGIFLVILFNRLAEEWRRKNPNVSKKTRAEALLEIIQTHLCGVEVKETACRITCFSLYLALLDHLQPIDIHELKERRGKVLPKLLSLKEDQYKTTYPPVIHEGNFFDCDIPCPKSFDLVIGNPPWVGRGQPADSKAFDWCSGDGNPFSKEAPKAKQARESYLMPQKQVAHAFMWKAPLHLSATGRACLLLPSKVFLNKTGRFQAGWFSNFTVEKVIQLSDLRFILFENASCPAMIVKFKPVKPVDENYWFDYEVPKVDRQDPRKGIVTILPEDQKKITAAEVASQSKDDNAPTIWKKTFWGLPRDLRLINKLLALPSLDNLVGTPQKPKRWIRGYGFKPFSEESYNKDPKKYGEPKIAWWPSDRLYIDAKSKMKNLILIEADCEKVGDKFKKLHRNPNENIFSPPMVLTNKGFSHMVFCDFPVIFQDALNSVSGAQEDERFFIFLVSVLNSKLAIYFQFHTAANWGTERDQVHLFEFLRLPFPLPESTPDPLKSEQIIKQVADCFETLKKGIQQNFLERKNLIKKTQGIIEPLIYEYYEISGQEKMLIEDTVNIFEPSSTPHSVKGSIPTLKSATFENRKTYVDLLCEVLNSWGKRSKFKVSCEAKISTSIGLGIVTLRKSDSVKPYSENTASDALQSSLKRISKTLPEEKGRFSYLRGLKVFEKNELHIVKPLALRHWTRSAALNDADEIAAAILSAGRDN